MCTPIDVIFNTVKFGTDIANRVNESKTLQYRKQIAVNNAKNAAIQALNASQEGLEKSREEKIKGLYQVNSQKAKNAANGFDMFSDTNMFQYQDIYNSSLQDARTIENSYYSKAKDYLTQRDGYLGQAKLYSKQAMEKNYNMLGYLYDVAEKWYNNSGVVVERDGNV